MRLSNWFMLAALCAVGLFFATANAAILEGLTDDKAYWVLTDRGVITYCEVALPGDTTMRCWAKGKLTMCGIITPDEGYIDCSIKQR